MREFGPRSRRSAIGTYELFTAIAPGSFTMPAGDEGGPLTAGVTASGTFDVGDIDLYRLTVLAGDEVLISLTDVADIENVSPVLEIYAEDGSLLAHHDSNLTASVAFTAPGSEILTVVAFNREHAVGDYDLLANVGTPLDTDGDGLSDEAELEIGTDPGDTDSDDDGVSDFDEANHDGDPDYNPLLDIDPNEADTDGDGFDDGVEIAAGSDPLDPLSVPPPPAIPAGRVVGAMLLAAALVLIARGAVRRRGGGA